MPTVRNIEIREHNSRFPQRDSGGVLIVCDHCFCSLPLDVYYTVHNYPDGSSANRYPYHSLLCAKTAMSRRGISTEFVHTNAANYMQEEETED